MHFLHGLVVHLVRSESFVHYQGISLLEHCGFFLHGDRLVKIIFILKYVKQLCQLIKTSCDQNHGFDTQSHLTKYYKIGIFASPLQH